MTNITGSCRIKAGAVNRLRQSLPYDRIKEIARLWGVKVVQSLYYGGYSLPGSVNKVVN